MRKVRLRIPPEAGWQSEAEWVWVEDVGNGRFTLRNVPYYGYGLSSDDIVRVELRDGLPEIVEVVARGGHSTYRLIAKGGFESEAARKILKALTDLGCDVERNTTSHWAIDVPPQTDVYAVYDLLEKGERSGVFEFEEGHCGHSLKSE